ncbi:AAA family ATPase [Salinimicrobium sediminilitoris]|uniref:AAA family ATPase n=1 Tax=Salinimicrobium sediminilitoris TaxID=2876715 RepID=UPI001E3FAB0D|nr:AAA family ATPase [Salinimicrobium sediminilitoris]MCC8360670.1 AAA family ATPase [Salinimicrobium sediminilitoris]
MNFKNNIEPSFVPGFHLNSLFDRWGCFNVDILYMGYFNAVASQQKFADLDLEKFYSEFAKVFEDKILGYHVKKDSSEEEWKSDFIYVLKNELMVSKEGEEVTVFFSKEHCKLLQEVIDFTTDKRKKEEDKAHINLIIMKPHGLDNRKIDFAKPELHLKKIYNDGFEVFHAKMLNILQEQNRSGLHLLYGKPGTGKSTYIRYLCGQIKKDIIFLPGQMAQNLDNIAMTRYLMDNANCILVIEDAEELIVSRDQQRNSNLAMILNITDGILGESLGIQIIATFNTDVKNIDPALKRKGRLRSAFEFKALSPEKANVLLREQHTGYATEEEMTLAEIYNISEEEQYKNPEHKAVGFR